MTTLAHILDQQADRAEFYDLADARNLNGESAQAGEPVTAWGNLGDWSQAKTYPDACEALARRLGEAADLGAHSRVFDVGFGCGDQLLYWLQHFRVAALCGDNVSASQTRVAKARLQAAGYAQWACQVEQGSAVDPKRVAGEVNTVLALDCAYHFPNRELFFRNATAWVGPAGTLALVDLVLGERAQPLPRKLVLSAMGRAAHFPVANRVGETTYRQQLADAGWEVTQWQDLTDCMFQPFGQWLNRYRNTACAPQLPARAWTKYRATARFLSWAARHDVLRAVLCVARRA